MAYQLDNRPLDFRERIYFPEVIRGIGTLTGHFLRNLFFSRDANPDILARPRGLGYSDNVTLQYPEEKAPYPPGYRGLHRLVPREDGNPRCVACYMCATACPAELSRISQKYPDGGVTGLLTGLDKTRTSVGSFRLARRDDGTGRISIASPIFGLLAFLPVHISISAGLALPSTSENAVPLKLRISPITNTAIISRFNI